MIIVDPHKISSPGHQKYESAPEVINARLPTPAQLCKNPIRKICQSFWREGMAQCLRRTPLIFSMGVWASTWLQSMLRDE